MTETIGNVGYEGDLGAVVIRDGKVIARREHLHPTIRQRFALWLRTIARRLS